MIYDELIKSIKNIKHDTNDKYVIFTEECYRENKDKILELNLEESDIKIYRIPDTVNMSLLMEMFK